MLENYLQPKVENIIEEGEIILQMWWETYSSERVVLRGNVGLFVRVKLT